MTDRNDDGLPEINLGSDHPPSARHHQIRGRRRGRAFLWAFAAVLFAFLLGAAAWPLLAPRLAAWLPSSFLPVYVAGDAMLAQVPGLAASLDDLTVRVGKLESAKPGSVADAGPELAALKRRLGALESAAAESISRNLGLNQRDDADAEGARDTLARLAREGAGNAARLANLEARLAKVEAAATATGLARVAAPLAFALADLRAALGASGPFAEQVSRVESLLKAGGSLDGPVDVPALADLAALSPTGVATLGELARDFPLLARDVLAAQAEGENPGWLGKTWARLASVVTVRRVGEVEGDNAGAILARAEARLAEEDLASALGEIAALQGPGADVAAAWREAARARLRADAAVAALESGLATAFARGPE